MAEIKEVTLKIGVETADGQNALQQFQKAVDQVGKTVEGAGNKVQAASSGPFINLQRATIAAGVSLVSTAASFTALVNAINRGGNISEVSKSFENISKNAGQAASVGIANLTKATEGMISKFDLMQSSNKALLAGLTPDQFLTVASAAEDLGAAINQGPKEALESLTNALLAGNDKFLKQYGLLIDNKAAEEEFAKSLGVTADKLTEDGKRQAARLAIIKEIPKVQKQIGDTGSNAADGFDKFQAALDNAYDRVAQGIGENDLLREAFNRLATAIDEIGLDDLAQGFLGLLGPVGQAIDQVLQFVNLLGDAGKGIDYLLGRGDAGKLAGINSKISGIDDELSRRAIGVSEQGPNVRSTEELKKNRAELQLQADAILNGAKASSEFDKTLAALDRTTNGYINTTAAFGVNLQKNTDNYIDYNKGQEEARKKAEALAEEVRKQTQAFKEQGLVLEAESLGKKLEDSIKGLDRGAFDSALAAYREKLNAATAEKLRDEFKELKLSDEEIQARVDAITGPKIQEAQDKFAEGQKEAFQESVDFFADILTSTITGTAQDLEDILSNALQRVAVGFGSQLLATLSESLGIDLKGISSAGDLGSAIFKELLGTGGNGILAKLGLVGPGGDFVGPLQPGTATVGTLGSFGLGAGALLGAVGGGGFLLNQGIKNGDPLTGGAGGALLGGALNLSLGPTIGGAVGAIIAKTGIFGGDSQKAKEREAREALLDKLFSGDLSFSGVGGQKTLSASSFNINQPAGSLNSKAVGLANPLAAIASGGDDKLGSDLAGIFANATGEADNFNEVMVNTLGLMDKLGFNAEDAKVSLADLFLSGKISLEEFTKGVENMNLLTQESLVGSDGAAASFETVADAMDIMAENINSNPRVALQGLAFTFKEMAEQGIDTTQEIHDYMAEHFPEMVGLFDKLAAAGYDTFDEIKNAGPDALAAIFGTLGGYGEELASIVGYNGDLQRQADTTREIGDGWKYAAEQKKKYAEVNAGGTPDPPPPPPPPGGATGNKQKSSLYVPSRQNNGRGPGGG